MIDDRPAAEPRLGAIIAVVICTLVIRGAFVAATADSLNADPDAYRSIAENLRQHGVYGSGSSPTAFRPPLYPVLLAALAVDGKVTSTIAGGLNVLFGVATVVLTFWLGRHWRLGRWSFAAAALVAIDPILLNQSSLVMTETLATCLATASLLAITAWNAKPSPRRALLAGLAIGLACLCRPTFLPWLGLVAGGMILYRSRWVLIHLYDGPPRPSVKDSTASEGRRTGYPNVPFSAASGIVRCTSWKLASLRALALDSIVFVLAAVIVISPWILRNYLVFGAPKATTTHGGYTVLLGNNPSFYRYLREAPRGTTWDAAELADAWKFRAYSTSPQDAIWRLTASPVRPVDATAISRSELEDDKFAYSLARHYIRDDPGMFVYSCVFRIGRLWQLTPYRTTSSESTIRLLSRILTGCWYSLLFLLAIVALVSMRAIAFRSPVVWGLLLCLAFTGMHAVYWSNMRMRAPLMPFVCLLAASGAARIANRLDGRKP